MKTRILAAVVAAGLVAIGTPAIAQSITLPANTVYGRLGIGSGPGQAIPFATLKQTMFGVSANPRPASETAYTIQPSDCWPAAVISANTTAAVTWTLQDPSAYPAGCTFIVKNSGSFQVTLQAGNRTIGALAGLPFATLTITPNQAATIFSDTVNWQYQLGIAGQANSSGQGINLYGYGQPTIGPQFNIALAGGQSCATAAGEVINVSYSWTGQSTITFSHTMTSASTCVQDAAADLALQVRTNAAVTAAIGYDINIQTSTRPAGTSGGWSFYWNQNYTFVTTKSPLVSAAVTGGSNVTVTTIHDASSTSLDNTVGLVFGRSFAPFKTPAANDGLGTIIWGGDTTGYAYNPFTDFPNYAAITASINNPATSDFPAGNIYIMSPQSGLGTINLLTGAAKIQAPTTIGGAGVNSGTLNINNNATNTFPNFLTDGTVSVEATDATPNRIKLSAFGGSSFWTGAVFAGTAAAPTAVQANTLMTGVNAYAYNGAALVGPIGGVNIYANENIASGHQGSAICLSTTPNSSTTAANGLCQQDGIIIGAPTGGDKGTGTLNATGLYINGTAVGSGTVGAGVAAHLAYYPASTAAVATNDNATMSAGLLTIGQAGSIIGQIALSGNTSGTTTLTPAAAASGTLTLPATTDTLIGKATTDVLTNKTFDTAGAGNVLKINGTQVSAVTGTGAAVLQTNPSITGTVTNDNAVAGARGEYIASTCPPMTGTAAATITVTIATPAVVTYTAHGLLNANGEADICPIVFTTTGALPTGITAGTVYWTIPASLTTNTFQIATSIANAVAGTAVATSGSQSGTQTGTFGAPATNSTALAVTAVSLPAGDWRVQSQVCGLLGIGATETGLYVATSTTINNLGTFTANGLNAMLGSATTGVNHCGGTSTIRQSLSGTTVIYATTLSVFSGGTNTPSGAIRAWRVR